MSANRLEAVLIRDPVDGDNVTVRIGVRVGSALDVADILRFGSDLFLKRKFSFAFDEISKNLIYFRYPFLLTASGDLSAIFTLVTEPNSRRMIFVTINSLTSLIYL